MDMRLAQPDAPVASEKSVQTDQLSLRARAVFAARRASWLRPLQLVRALLGCVGSRVDGPVSVRYTGPTESLPLR